MSNDNNNGDDTGNNGNILQFGKPRPGNPPQGVGNGNVIQKEKHEPHVWEITYLDGQSETAEGYLSVGPVFIAVVDGKDFIQLVISSDTVRSIRKLCTVAEMEADLERGPDGALEPEDKDGEEE